LRYVYIHSRIFAQIFEFMKHVLFGLLIAITFASCTKDTNPRYIQKKCCNSEETQWVFAQSPNDSGAASFFFMPQIFAPGTEAANSNFKSVESGVANYKITIRIGEDAVWLYDGPAPISWNGDVASSQLAAQSGIYNYDLVATFTNGETVTISKQYFCLIREFATCPDNVNTCVLNSMFDINDTTAPIQYINEAAVTSTRIYDRCVNP
jgi:hypothetical protein